MDTLPPIIRCAVIRNLSFLESNFNLRPNFHSTVRNNTTHAHQLYISITFNNIHYSNRTVTYCHPSTLSKLKQMQATSSSSLMLLSTPLSGNFLRQSTPLFASHKLVTKTTTTRRSFIHASKKDSYGHRYDGKLVDENMILLRMRIREIEMVEMKCEAPSDWTEWEKKYFENYGSDVYEVVGLLQRLLMNTRPSFAVAMLALVTLSMSMSMSLLVFHLVQFAKGII